MSAIALKLNALRAVNLRSVLIVAAAIALGLLFGLVVPVYAGLMGGSATKLAALPALLALAILLVYDAKLLFLGIMLVRAAGDIVLDTTRFSLGGTQLGVGALLNAAVVAITLLFVFKRPAHLPKDKLLVWMPFTLLCLLEFMVAPVKGEAIRTYLALISYLAMFVAPSFLVRNREDFTRAMKLVVWSSILPICYAFVDAALHHAEVPFRLRSTFGHANIFAFYLNLILALCLYLVKSPNVALSQGQRATIMAYMGMLFGMLLLTQTRSAWIACMAVFVIYALLFERKYLIYMVVACMLALLVPQVRDRILDLGKGNEVYQYAKLNSFAWRVLLWQDGLRFMEVSRYAFGYGLEAFRYYSLQFFPLAGGINWSPHNLYVQWLFDIGVVGLLSYLFIFWNLLKRLFILFGSDRLAAVILIAVTISYMLIGASDNLFAYLAFNWYFWFVAGSAWALVQALPKPPSKRRRYGLHKAPTERAAQADAQVQPPVVPRG